MVTQSKCILGLSSHKATNANMGGPTLMTLSKSSLPPKGPTPNIINIRIGRLDFQHELLEEAAVTKCHKLGGLHNRN
jgi:hypothetical protein